MKIKIITSIFSLFVLIACSSTEEQKSLKAEQGISSPDKVSSPVQIREKGEHSQEELHVAQAKNKKQARSIALTNNASENISLERQKIAKNVVDDEAKGEKKFAGIGLLKPGNCKTEIKIWKIREQADINVPVVIRKLNIPVKIRGIVIDLISKDGGAALYADVNGYRFKAKSNLSSPDLPTYKNAGYEIEIPEAALAFGRQEINFNLVRSEKQAYCRLNKQVVLDVQ